MNVPHNLVTTAALILLEVMNAHAILDMHWIQMEALAVVSLKDSQL